MSKPPKYRVIRPSAGIVSTHRTRRAAERSLRRQQIGSRMQGGYCEDYMEQFGEDGRYTVVVLEEDTEE